MCRGYVQSDQTRKFVNHHANTQFLGSHPCHRKRRHRTDPSFRTAPCRPRCRGHRQLPRKRSKERSPGNVHQGHVTQEVSGSRETVTNKSPQLPSARLRARHSYVRLYSHIHRLLYIGISLGGTWREKHRGSKSLSFCSLLSLESTVQ